ncbi:Eukaryotic translation initiation factor 2 subunit 2 [Hondaea fermentalgiana]|uniref:Eukaryotic translation initiation factor 2 subunit 2 n=1 Tax=Hondaea fermentalgiana TaxID=2315210 RepID=A0A2R5GDR3_9STRA|nr:Eukaryotic translation initiation factor 2 subunit 2 [Hondaea fermentalgiana]|eukprot:GBG29070.1 Eukaryotic translation initiation factor 2 subunit 2 [Hondaea fermentalgiana]
MAEEPTVNDAQVDESVQAMLDSLKLSKKKSKKSKKKKEIKDSPLLEQGEAEELKANKRSITDAGEFGFSYQHLLDRMYAELRANNPDLVNKKRAVLRPPEVMRLGTSKILFANFDAICQGMRRDPDHVMRFFLAELGTTGSIDGSKRFIMKGKFTPKNISSILVKYIGEYVTCSMCKQVETKLVRDANSRMAFLQCQSCGASRAVAPIQKGYHATGRGERRAARYAGNA